MYAEFKSDKSLGYIPPAWKAVSSGMGTNRVRVFHFFNMKQLFMLYKIVIRLKHRKVALNDESWMNQAHIYV